MRRRAQIAASLASAIALAGCSFLLNDNFAGDEPPSAPPAEAGTANDTGGSTNDGAVVVSDSGSEAASDASDAADAALDPSLVAFWSFDEAPTAQVVTDKTGHGHDLVLSGATVAASGGVRGGALVIQELQAAKVSSLSALNFPTKGTLSFWFKYLWADNDPAGRGIFDDWDSSRAHLFVRKAPGEPAGHLQVALQNATNDYAWVQDFDTSRDKWTHVVLAWDPSASTAALYIDGALSKSGAYYQYPGTSPSSQEFIFGKYFVGSIDEVAIYDRVLTTAEALKLP